MYQSPLNKGVSLQSCARRPKILRQDDFIKGQLVLTMWRHGKDYGGHLASCIIGSCIANRVKAGWGNWLQVIDNIPKFAAIQNMPTGTPQIWEPQFVHLLHDVEAIYATTRDDAKGGLYWCDTRNIETPFFQNRILYNSDHPRVCEMNTLAIFK